MFPSHEDFHYGALIRETNSLRYTDWKKIKPLNESYWKNKSTAKSKRRIKNKNKKTHR